MKLLRYGTAGQERPGLLDAQGQVRDLSGIIEDVNGKTIAAESLARLAALDIESLPLVDKDLRLGPCVNHVGKFICIGLNYADHAAESGLAVPAEPVVFMKARAVGNQRLLRHELEHVRQWREWGFVGFLVRYLGSYLRWRLRRYPHWAAYRRIPFEAEAEWVARRTGPSSGPSGSSAPSGETPRSVASPGSGRDAGVRPAAGAAAG